MLFTKMGQLPATHRNRFDPVSGRSIQRLKGRSQDTRLWLRYWV